MKHLKHRFHATAIRCMNQTGRPGKAAGRKRDDLNILLAGRIFTSYGVSQWHRKLLFTAVILLLVLNGIHAQYEPGQVYYGTEEFVEYHAGNLPLIISVPHGGSLKPSWIPDRECATCVYVKDSWTAELAAEITDAVYDITGRYPHVIYCNLHRTKLDANRDLWEAALGNPDAGAAWYEYHRFIDSAKIATVRTFGKGFFVDLHGHGHAIERLELGYMLTATILRGSDESLENESVVNISSIKNLVSDNLKNLGHADLLRGSNSLGTLVEGRMFRSVPSTYDPFPLAGEYYFSGGYNTGRHGSSGGGTIDGVQIECNPDVRFDAETRVQFAGTLALSLIEYLQLHYFDDPSVLFGSTGIVHESENNAPWFYPNPTAGMIRFTDITGSITVRIMDGGGRVLLAGVVAPGGQMDTGSLLPGLYFIMVDNGNGAVKAGKLIIR